MKKLYIVDNKFKINRGLVFHLINKMYWGYVCEKSRVIDIFFNKSNPKELYHVHTNDL